MTRIALMIMAGLFLLTQANPAEARNFRPAMLPNAPDGCNTCHTTGGGTPRNPFGLDVEALVTPGGDQQFWGPALAELDSDGDGVPNGQELGDPDGDGDPDPSISVTSPGDPNSFLFPPISIDSWLSGPDAVDLNFDGFTDEIDFYFFDPEAWFGSPEEFDFNFDGGVDFEDYFAWVDANSAEPPPPVDGEPPELTALLNLRQQFIDDPNLELIFVDELVDLEPFVRDILNDFSGGTGELSFEDVENAIATFDQEPPATFELQLLYGLLDEFDVDPDLDFILVDDLTALTDEERGFLHDVAFGDGELSRQDLEEAIAQFEGGEPQDTAEQELVLSLLEEFDLDPNLEVIFVDDLTHLDDFQRDFLINISGGSGEVRRADLETFLGDPGPGPDDEPTSITLDTWLGGPDAVDLNFDGFTDEIDFYFFDPQAWFGSSEEFDFNFDGVVDFDDYVLWSDANSVAPPPDVGEPPELTALFDLQQRFLDDPDLDLIFVDELVDLEPFVRDILLDFSGGSGELSFEDVENAIATFQQEPPASFELELLLGLLEEFDVDPDLDFILVDSLTELSEEDRQFLHDVAFGDGELTRQDLEEAIAQFDTGAPQDTPEQELALSLLEEFDLDPNLEVIFVDDLTHLDDFQRDFLNDISGGSGEVRRADLEAFLGDPGPGPDDEPPELVLLRQLNEEFVLDPGLDVIFIDALDIADFERDFLLGLAPGGELTRELVADELAILEGPASSPELDFLFSLLFEFDADPGLIIFADEPRFDEFERELLFQFADESSALRREDIDIAIAAFSGGDTPPDGDPQDTPEFELVLSLLEEFDLDPNLEVIFVDDLTHLEDFQRDFLNDISGGSGEVRRADLEAFLGDPGPGPDDEPPELALLRQLNEEFVLDPGLDVIFIDALDITDFERDFLFALAPSGELTRELVADELAILEGPASNPDLDFFLSLLPEFDQDPDLVLFADDGRFDEFQQSLLFQFSNEVGEVRREDIEFAIEVFGGDGGGGSEPPASERDLIFTLLEEFDLNPDLQFIPVDDRFDDFQRDFLNGISGDSGEVTRPDLEAALADLDGPDIPSFEEAAGRIGEIDLGSGIIRLNGTVVGINGETVFLDGATGAVLEQSDFEPGDAVVVHAVWDTDGRAVARQVVRNGEVPEHSTALWLQFGEIAVSDEGQVVLKEPTGEYQLTDQTLAFALPDFVEYDPAQLQSGDFVIMQTQGTENGFEILEIQVEQGEQPMEFRNILLPLFDIDLERSQVRFGAEPVILSASTQFLDANGNPVPTSAFTTGDVVLVELDLQAEAALAIRQLDPDQPVPFPDDPEIIAFEVGWAGVEGDVLNAIDPYPMPLATDVLIADDETGEQRTLADVIARSGEDMWFGIRLPRPGDTVGDLVVDIRLDPVDGPDEPDEPGERPEPNEIFGEWEGIALVGEIELETLTLTKAGVRLRRTADTVILDRDGNEVGAAALDVGEKIRVSGRATSNPRLIIALEVVVDPAEPMGPLPFSTFETEILRLDGDEIVTAAGSYWISQEVDVFAGPTGAPLDLAQLNPGDRVRYVIIHTDVGDFVQVLERDPVSDEPEDEFWEGEYPILSIDPATGVVLIAGPPSRTIETTLAFDAAGDEIPLDAIPPRTPVVIEQVPSTGGAPVVVRVDVEHPDLDFDRPNLVFARFIRVEGDQLVTAEFDPKFLALDAEIVDIDGSPITAAQIPPESNVHLTVLHPPPELYSPLGNIVVAMAVGAASPPGGDPGVPGFDEKRGFVADFDVDAGIVALDGFEVVMLDETEIFDGLTGEILDPQELQEGDDLAVHVWWTVDGDAIARAVVRDGEHPEGVPTLWIEFGGFDEWDDGTRVLVENDIEYSLAFEATAVSGPDRQQIPLGDVVPGDEVILSLQHDAFGTSVLEIHQDPPSIDEPGEEEPFWGMTQQMFDVDPELGVMRFAKDLFGVTVNTRYLDERGNPTDPASFAFGDPIVAQVDFRSGNLLILQREDPDVPFPHPDDPDIGVIYAAFGFIEDRVAFLFDSYGFTFAIDAPILDEQSGESLDAEQLADFAGEFVYVLVQHPQLGDAFGDLIVEIIVNPDDRPLGPGERPTPTEVFGAWEDIGVVGEVLVETQEILMAGIQVQVNEETEVINQNGFEIAAADLRAGDLILINGQPRSDHTVEASHILVEPEFPPQGFELPLFTEVVLRVDGDIVVTQGGRWWFDEDASFSDEVTDEDLEITDFAPGDQVRYNISHTNVGDFVQELVRNPVADEPIDDIWFQDGEVFAFDPEARRLLFLGPQFAIRNRTEAFDRLGRRVSLSSIPSGAEVVIQEEPSFTGGPPVAASVEVFNPETVYDGFDLVFATFAGIDGDLIITTDFPRFVALDADISFGSGDPGNPADLVPGARIRAVINHPPPGLYSPFGDIVAAVTIDPEFEGPLATGEVHGLAFNIDEANRILTLEGEQMSFGAGIEIVGLDLESLSPEQLVVGDLLAVNFFPAFDGLRATKIRLVDPLRIPDLRDDLIVAPLLEIDAVDGFLFLQGAEFLVPETSLIFGPDESEIAFGAIQSGDFVWITAVEEDGLAVAERIEVAEGFDGPLFAGGGLEILSVFPQPGEVGVSTEETFEVEFNELVGLLSDVDEDFGIGFWPLPESPVGVGIAGDGRTLVAEVSLLEDTVYQLFVTSERFGLYSMTFTTGEALPEGAVWGSVDVPAEVPVEVIAPEESGVLLIDAIADLDEGVADEDVIMIAPFSDTGEYHFENVPDGSYIVYAELVLEFGADHQLVLDAFHLGEEGEPAVLQVAGGMVEGVALTILPPDPFAIDDMSPASGATGLTLENEFSVTFSEPVGLDSRGLPDVNGVIRPLPPSGKYRREDLVVSEDGLTVSLPVTLEANTTYSFALRDAVSASGLNLEGHRVVVATTGAELPTGSISGRLALPSGTPPDRVIRTPATIMLVPTADFDPLDPDVGQAAVAATLSSDGTYSFANAPAGSHAVIASVDVALPGDFRLKIGDVDSAFDAFVALGTFGREAPADYSDFPFIGFAEDATPDLADVDFLLRPEDVRRGGLRVTGVQPDEATLANSPTQLELEVDFSEAVDLNGFVASLDPLPPSGDILANFAIEEGGQRLRFTEIELELATIYIFSVTSARALDTEAVLPEPYRLVVKTEGAGDLALGSVSGNISLDGDEISEAAVLLLDPTAEFVRVVGGALVGSDGSYTLGNVAQGEYGLLLEAKTVSGRDLLESYDPEADGTGNNIQVGEGPLVDIDFSLSVAALPDEGANANAGVSLDLDNSAGDQGVRNLQVEAGETVQLEIHADDLVGAASYSMNVGFDPSQLEFSRVSPGGADPNLLATAEGALVRFAPPALSGSGLQFSGAVVSATNATAANGGGLLAVVEFTALEAYTSSTIRLDEVSFVDVDGGRNSLQPDVSVLVAEPLNLFDLPKGPLSFDFAPAPGDDELFHLGNVRPGEEFSVEVFANEVTDQINYSIKVSYDPAQLTYISFSAGGFLGSGGGNAFSLPPLLTESTVEFGSAILGAVESQAVTGNGSMGSLTFSTTESFTETDLVIVEYSIGSFGVPQESIESSIFARVSQESLGGESQTNADFDGNGEVDFQDFFALAAVFGSRVTPETSIYDLDLDGFIGFGDLFRLSDNFGRTVAKGAMGESMQQVPGTLQLTAESNGDLLDVILGSEDLPLGGYGLVVAYDESAFRLRRVVDTQSALRGNGTEPLLLTFEEPGQVIVSGSIVGSVGSVSELPQGRLATLQFEPLSAEAVGDFVIQEAVVNQGDGVVAQPQELGRVRARWAPHTFVLHQNYPNPFNPSTTVRYQLADTGPVRLQIFDSLGQQVRSLVDESQLAGYHRVVWDSRDDRGSQVAAGVYFYRLEAGAFSDVNKLLLLK